MEYVISQFGRNTMWTLIFSKGSHNLQWVQLLSQYGSEITKHHFVCHLANGSLGELKNQVVFKLP